MKIVSDMTSNALTGQCFDVHTGQPIPGLEYVLGTDTNPQLYDTIVMANLVSLFLSLTFHCLTPILW